MPLTRPCSSSSTFVATACGTIRTQDRVGVGGWSPGCRRMSSYQVLSEEYLACTGQIGMQFVLPSHRSPSCGFPGAPAGA
jgi:hypothetical protein